MVFYKKKESFQGVRGTNTFLFVLIKAYPITSFRIIKIPGIYLPFELLKITANSQIIV